MSNRTSEGVATLFRAASQAWSLVGNDADTTTASSFSNSTAALLESVVRALRRHAQPAELGSLLNQVEQRLLQARGMEALRSAQADASEAIVAGQEALIAGLELLASAQ